MSNQYKEVRGELQISFKTRNPPCGGFPGSLISRILCPAYGIAIIYLGRPSPAGSIGLPSGLGGHPSACQTFTYARRETGRSLTDNAGLHGLSAPGVYLAADVATDTGGLLPHPFTLTRDKSRAVCFLWRYPSGFRLPASPGGRYPPPCLRGARTFLQQPPLLEGMACQRSPSRPIERGTYQRTTERAIPPVSAARTSQFSNNCAWLWPVQVRITTSWPCVIWRVLCV